MSGNHAYIFSVLVNISPCQRVRQSQIVGKVGRILDLY